MSSTRLTYDVPDVSCGHCRTAITDELATVPGVAEVDVDLDAKRVRIAGTDLDDTTLVAAIREAGYEAARS
jgi:copper chaperone CopZ